MRTYVALLRGVNVAGRNKIPMAALRTAVEDLGYEEVTTYVQSGNVVFTAAAATERAVVQAVERAIRRAFGLEVPVLVRSGDQLVRVSARHPLQRPRRDPATLHVTFLAEAPTPSGAGRCRTAPSAPTSSCSVDARSTSTARTGTVARSSRTSGWSSSWVPGRRPGTGGRC